MTTITETNELLARLDIDIAQAEAQLATAEGDLNRAARHGRSLDRSRGDQAADSLYLDRFAREVDGAQKQLDALKGRRDRVLILDRLKEQEDAKAADARKAHEAAVKKSAATLKRELTQLDDSAQQTADSIREAVSAVRAAINQARVHSALVKGAAERVEALGLPLVDEYNRYDTGASTERGKAVVRSGGQVFGSIDGAQLQQILKWVNAQVDRTELHGRDMGTGYLKSVDGAIRQRLTN